MTDQATEHAVIAAPLQQVFATLIDFDHYAAWASDIKETEVVERDDEGRAVEVIFRAAAMGRSSKVRLRYDYSSAPEHLSWKLVEGDIVRAWDGSYTLREVEGDAEITEVDYELTVDVVVPLPGFVKRRAEAKVMKAALPELKLHVESQR